MDSKQNIINRFLKESKCPFKPTTLRKFWPKNFLRKCDIGIKSVKDVVKFIRENLREEGAKTIWTKGASKALK